MKISITFSLLILAAAAGLGWHDHERLVTVRENHTKLVAEAATLGISIDPAHPTGSVRITKRERENREAEAKQAAIEFIAFAKEMEAIEKQGGQPDEATQNKIMDLMDRMMSLDSAQLRMLIAEVRAAKDLNDETRQGLIAFSIMTLASDHPQAALALFTESSDIFEDGKQRNMMSEHVISSSLARWAEDDPMAALTWVRKNGEKYPDLVTDDAKHGLVTGAATNDPKIAFKLIAELGLKDSSGAFAGVMTTAKTPEERTAALAALRAHLATLPDEKARSEKSAAAFGALTDGLAQQGFAAASQWIDGANLSPDELGGLAGALGHISKSEETGQWIEWLGEKMPPDKSDKNIRSLVREWTENDYQAAGKWLGSTPDGPAKNISIRTYAETVAGYEPETAAQWAMTLPPGKDRDTTLRRIHQNWPKNDAAGKEAFANEHGIK